MPGTLSRLLGVGVDPIRYALAAAYLASVIGLLVWVLRGADWVRAAGWAALGLLVATAWLVPWYLIWVLPLAAVSRDRPLVVATVLLTAVPGDQRCPGLSPAPAGPGRRAALQWSVAREPEMRRSPEFELITEIRARLDAAGATAGAGLSLGIGDDAAVTRPGRCDGDQRRRDRRRRPLPPRRLSAGRDRLQGARHGAQRSRGDGSRRRARPTSGSAVPTTSATSETLASATGSRRRRPLPG